MFSCIVSSAVRSTTQLVLFSRSPGEGAGGGARAVAETVQHFITAMDSLKLNLVAVDQVRP